MFKLTRKEKKYIGEVYCGKHHMGSWGIFPVHAHPDASYIGWIEFTNNDISHWNQHDDFLEIFGHCHKKENVLFYDDIYKTIRSKVEKRILMARNKLEKNKK